MVVWLYQVFVPAVEFIKTACSLYCQQVISACLSQVPDLYFLLPSLLDCLILGTVKISSVTNISNIIFLIAESIFTGVLIGHLW